MTKDRICNGWSEHVVACGWWKSNGWFEMKWTERAIDIGSAEGHLNVLQRWKDNGTLDKVHHTQAVDDALKQFMFAPVSLK
ncbi:hypothetical protein BJ742DRAFT_774049 [Cladochytrium replicatum]|nr:hypothetical protein BJ742DRAFT_774049 [Cladochytrium replicatum]